MNTEHSILAPSAAARWLTCPGSLVACKELPDIKTNYADEGHLAHEIAEFCLTNNLDAKDKKVKQKFKNAPDEMPDHINQYISAVRGMTAGADLVNYEEKTDLSSILGVSDTGGTADVIAYFADDKILQIHDFKYGKGVPVSPVQNPQLILYALGARGIVALIGEIEDVVLIIHQPRLKAEPEQWSLSSEELDAFGRSAAVKAKYAFKCYETGKVTGGDYQPSEKACRWCAAKSTCKYLAAYIAKNVTDEFDNLNDESLPEKVKAAVDKIVDIDMNVLGRLLLLRGLVRDWLNAIEYRALAELKAGNAVAFHKLVEGRAGNRKWDDDKGVEELLKSMRIKKDEMYNLKLISPTQAEKTPSINTKRKWCKITEHITRSEPAPAIVHESDPRPAIVIEQADAEFDDLT